MPNIVGFPIDFFTSYLTITLSKILPEYIGHSQEHINKFLEYFFGFFKKCPTEDIFIF